PFLLCRCGQSENIKVQALTDRCSDTFHLLWRAPTQRLLRIRHNTLRTYAAQAESLDECRTILIPVVGNEIVVGGNQRPQEITKQNVDRRAIVQSANADVCKVPSDLCRFFR